MNRGKSTWSMDALRSTTMENGVLYAWQIITNFFTWVWYIMLLWQKWQYIYQWYIHISMRKKAQQLQRCNINVQVYTESYKLGMVKEQSPHPNWWWLDVNTGASGCDTYIEIFVGNPKSPSFLSLHAYKQILLHKKKRLLFSLVGKFQL